MKIVTEARRQRNQEELNSIRETLVSYLDHLQSQIDNDTLDSINLNAHAAVREVTAEGDKYVQWKPLGYRAITLHVVERLAE